MLTTLLARFGIIAKPAPVLRVGDRMHLNVDAVDTLQVEGPYEDLLHVEVHEIRELADGSKELVMRNVYKRR